MRALASQELNPMIIPPEILKTILHKIEEDIRSNARLKLLRTPKPIFGLTMELLNWHLLFARLLNVNVDCSLGRSITSDESI